MAYLAIKALNLSGDLIKLYSEGFILERMLVEKFIPIHALLFQSELIRLKCKFDEQSDVFEDWDFLIRQR